MSGNDEIRGTASSERLVACQSRVRSFHRQAMLLMWLAVFVLGSILVAFVQFEEAWRNSAHSATWCLAAILGLSVATILTIVGLFARLNGLMHQLGCDCGRCGKRIPATDQNLAIALHCCPNCGNGLFADETQTSPSFEEGPVDSGGGPFTLDQIRQSERHRNQVFRKSLTPTAITIGTCCTVGMVAIQGIQQSGFLRKDDQTILIAKAIIMALTAIVLGFTLLFSIRRANSVSAACCPGCERHIEPSRLLRLTGCCAWCGRTVVRDSLLNLMDCQKWGKPTISRAEYTDQLRQHWTRMVYLVLLLIVFGGLGWTAVVLWLTGTKTLQAPITPTQFAWSNLGLFIMVALLGWSEQRSRMRLSCPHCQQSLLTSHRLTQATGNCSHCGQAVLILGADKLRSNI